MPRGIDVTLALKIQDPNVASLKSVLQKSLSGLGANVDIKINANGQRGLNAVNDALSQLRNSATSSNRVSAQLVNSLNNVGASASKTSSKLLGGSNALKQLEKSAGSASKELGTTNSLLRDLGESIGVTSKRFVAFTVAATAILQVVNASKDAVDQAVEYQRQLVRLKQVGGDTASEIQGISKTISELSRNLGASSADLIKTSVTLRQAGFSAKETSAALDVLAKTELAATFDGLANTTEGLIAIFNQFKPSASEFKKIFSEINAVSAAYAVEASDIVKGVQSAGGAFKAAGGNIEQFIALLTSVRSTTRESADTIATGFRTIFGRLQRPEVIQELKRLGVTLQDSKGQFIGAFEAVRQLNEGLSNIPDSDPRFARIVEQIGGIRQISRVIPLIKEFGKAQEALNVARAAGNSLDRDAETAQGAFATQTAKLKEEFLDLFRVVGSNNSIKEFVRLSLEGASAVVKLAKGLEVAAPLLLSIGAVSALKLAPQIGSGISNRPSFSSLRRASGGGVPGSGNHDSVPALLTPGEFVINKRSAQALGSNVLNSLNNTAGVQRFAAGGRVRDLLRTSGLGSLNQLQTALSGSGITLPKDSKGRLNGGANLSSIDFRLASQFLQGNTPGRTGAIPIIGGGSSTSPASLILPSSYTPPPSPLPAHYQPSISVAPSPQIILPGVINRRPNPQIIPDDEFSSLVGRRSRRRIRPADASFLKDVAPLHPSRVGFEEEIISSAQSSLIRQPRGNPTRFQNLPTGAPTGPSINRGVPSNIADFSVDHPFRSLVPQLPNGEVERLGAAFKEASNFVRDIGNVTNQNVRRGGNPQRFTPGGAITPGELPGHPAFESQFSFKVGAGNRVPPNVNDFTGSPIRPGSPQSQPFNINNPLTRVRGSGKSFFRVQDIFGDRGQDPTEHGQEIFERHQEAISQLTDVYKKEVRQTTRRLSDEEILNRARKKAVEAFEKNAVVGFGGDDRIDSFKDNQVPVSSLGVRKSLRRVSSRIGRFGAALNNVGQNPAALLAADLAVGQINPTTRGEAGLKGGVSGGALGLFLGSSAAPLLGKSVGKVAGPLGLAAGAVIGGANAVQSQIEAQRRQELDEQVSGFSRNLGNLNSNNLGATLKGFQSTLEAVEENAKNVAPLLSEKGSSFSEFFQNPAVVAKSRSNARNRVFTDSFSGQLPQLQNLGNELAKSVTNIKDFEKANDGAGASLINLISKVGGLPTDQVKKSFEDLIKINESSKAQKSNNDTLNKSISQLSTRYDHLDTAIKQASASISLFEHNLDTTSIVFDGIKATRNNSLTTNLEGIGRTSPGRFDRSIGQLVTAFGGGGIAREFGANASGLNRLQRILPSIVNSVTSDATNPEALSKRFEDQISRLGDDVPKIVKENLVNAFGSINPEDILKNAGDNLLKFTDKLIEDAFPNFTETLTNAAKQVEEASNKFVENLVKAAELQGRVNQVRTRNAENRLDLQQFRADRFAENIGQTGTNQLSLRQRLNPFGVEQQGLTGLQGLRSFNPLAIGERAQSLQSQIAANRSRRETLINPTDIQNSDRAFVELQRQLSNTVKGLENLSNSANLAAPALADLEQVRGEKANRLSFARQFLTSDIGGRQRIGESFGLTQVARQSGLGALNPDQISRVLSLLDSLENVKLPQFGGSKGGDLRDALIRQAAPGLASSPELDARENFLKNSIDQAKSIAVEASNQLANILQKNQSDFYEKINSLQTKFFAELPKSLSESLKLDTLQRISNQQQNVNTILKSRNSAQSITDDFGSIDVARKLAGNSRVSDLAGALSSRSSVLSNLNDFTNNPLNIKLGSNVGGATPDIISQGFLNPRSQISPRIQKLIENATPSLSALERENKIFSPISDELTNLQRTGRTNISNEQISGIANKFVRNALLRKSEGNFGIPGLVGGIAGETGASPDQISKFAQDFDANKKRVEDVGVKSLEALNTEYQSANSLLTEFNNQLNRINGNLGAFGAPQRRAKGGPIYAANGRSIFGFGSDTVPALLTPGEFVVNAGASRRNLKLLSDINRGREPRTLTRSQSALQSVNNNDATRKLLQENEDRQRAVFELNNPTSNPRVRRQLELLNNSRASRVAEFQASQQAAQSERDQLNLPLQRQLFLKEVAFKERAREIERRRARRAEAEQRGFPRSPFYQGFRQANPFITRTQLTGLAGRRAAFGFAEGGEVQYYGAGDLVYNTAKAGVNFAANSFKSIRDYFKPRGTDTVPAMLTPGEFVVNAKATKANKELLQRINNGDRMATGGTVGGNDNLPNNGFSLSGDAASLIKEFGNNLITPLGNFVVAADKLGAPLAQFTQTSSALAASFSKFNETAQNLANALSNIKVEIERKGSVEVIINGASVLSNIKGDLEKYIREEIATQISKNNDEQRFNSI